MKIKRQSHQRLPHGKAPAGAYEWLGFEAYDLIFGILKDVATDPTLALDAYPPYPPYPPYLPYLPYPPPCHPPLWKPPAACLLKLWKPPACPLKPLACPLWNSRADAGARLSDRARMAAVVNAFFHSYDF
jgi:hypothetical protein